MKLIFAFLLVFAYVIADEVADILFRTNLEELHDFPIYFDSPLPAWLKGTMMRNGVGRFEMGHRKFKNGLDAFAKVASWRFPGNSSAFYSTRFIHSQSYNQSLAENDIAPFVFLDKVDPPFDIIKELECIKNGPDNMNINIFNFGGDKNDFVVVSDYWNLYTIDPYSLMTLKGVHPPVPNITAGLDQAIVLGSAHPLPEYRTNNYLTFVSVVNPIPAQKSKLILTRTKSSSEREIIASIEVDKASYMHSFGVTENYAILFAVPFYFNPLRMVKGFSGLNALEWVSTDITTLFVVNLKTGVVQTLKTENMFFLHIVNAYESDSFDNKLIIDICTFHDTSGLHEMEMDRLRYPKKRAVFPMAILKRYILDLTSSEVDVYTYKSQNHSIAFVNGIDFPTINEKHRSKKYCYTYGIAYNYDGQDFLNMTLVKKNLCEENKDRFYNERGIYMNEAYFIPSPYGSAEDDGVLVLPVLDIYSKTTSFTIFNATDLSIITKAKLPHNIPFGTHGRFFDYVF